MRIVLWGTYDTGKPRIRILREGLRARGVEVIEIHARIWEDVEDKSRLGRWSRVARGLRLVAAYPRLAWRYLRSPTHDLVLVAYPGQLDVLVMRPLAWIRRMPVAFDWFISAYDTVVHDRRLVGTRHPLAWLLWAGEYLASRAADCPFMDTAAHARRMETLFGLPAGTVDHVWVGAEAAFFRAVDSAEQAGDGNIHVLFYGQFIPLHGIDVIIEAARLARGEPIRWTLIGRGQETPRIRAMLEQAPLPNLEWVDWVAYTQLPERIARADICLGIFGTSGKAASVIPNKVFQIVASGKPLITRDSPAIRELLDDEPPCTRLVPANDSVALVEAVRSHARFPSGPCHARARERIDGPAVAGQFLALVASVGRADRKSDGN